MVEQISVVLDVTWCILMYLYLMMEANLIPRVGSEPLFHSSSQKTTLVQRVIFEGVFSDADKSFRVLNASIFIVILFRELTDSESKLFVLAIFDKHIYFHCHFAISSSWKMVKYFAIKFCLSFARE